MQSPHVLSKSVWVGSPLPRSEQSFVDGRKRLVLTLRLRGHAALYSRRTTPDRGLRDVTEG